MIIQRKRVAKRLASGLLAGALALGGLAISSGTASATSSVSASTRTAGTDRYGTAIKLSGTAAETKIVLVNGESFADGLSAAFIAGVLDADVLLTASSGLPDAVLTHINTITGGASAGDTIVLVGGESAIPASTESQLKALGYTVVRFGGTDRYATADAVAAAGYTNNSNTIGLFGGYKTAFLASGTNFADALAASAWAYGNRHPIFLTDGTSLSAGTKAAIVAAGVQQIIVLGGTAAVSDAVKDEANSLSGIISTVRVGGADRYETATKLATTLSAVDVDAVTKVFLVDGKNFPDALALSQYAGVPGAGGIAGAIIPVTSPLPAAVSTWLAANQATVNNIETIGGISAVSDATVAEAKAAATIAQLTATIAVADGATTATVTLSANLDSNTVDASAADFVILNSSGAPRTATAAYTAANAATGAAPKIVLTLAAAGTFAPGDTISLVAGALAAVGDATLFVTPTSATVVADTSAPTATITAYPGAINDTAKVWVTFSANTDLSTVDTAALDSTDFVVTKGSGAIGATAAKVNTCVQVGSTTTYKCGISTAALVAGDVVTLIAGSVSSSASTAVPNAAVSAVVGADLTAPVLQSARYSQSATGGASASFGIVAVSSGGAAADGDVIFTAKATGAAAGKAGNSYKVVVDGDGAANSCTYSAASKTITVVATSAAVTAPEIEALCDANADISSLFDTTSTTADSPDYSLTGIVDKVATAMTGGLDLLTMTLTFSEPLGAAVAGNFTVSAQVTDQASKAITAAAATDAGRLTGTLTLTVQTSGAPLAGVSTVTVAAGVTDRNGNAVVVTTPPATHIVSLFPA